LLAWLLILLDPASAADPVQIDITDPSARKVVLDCEGKIIEAPVRNGKVSFTQANGKCEVMLLSRVGVLDGPAQYTCGQDGCVQRDVIHKDIVEADNRITVVITDSSTTLLELICPSGYRQRSRVETNTAVFDNVPTEDCNLLWKGGSIPAKARKLRTGTWYCQATSGTGVCKRR